MAQPTFISAVALTPGTSASPGAQAITVPSDATHVAVFWGAYDGGAAFSSLSASFADFTGRIQNTPGDSSAMGVGVAWSPVSATGSQTITPVWNATVIEGPSLFVAFVKGVTSGAPVNDMDSGHATGITPVSFAINSNADALVIALDIKYTNTPPGNPLGWTNSGTSAANDQACLLRTAQTPGDPTTTVTTQNSDYSGLAAISFNGASGGATNYTLTCDVGSYSLTGIAALLRRGYSVVANVGSYVISGHDAALRRGYSLVCSTGSYAITGYDATLTYVPGPTAYSLTCDVGSYSLTGYDATLTYGAGPTNYSLTCDVGSYSITGYDATLTYSAGAANYSLSCDVGAYALTGIDATLTYTPGAAHYTLTCDTGAYALTGVAATLSFGRRLAADTGSYAITGQTATLVYGRRLICATGSYSLTGQDATLTAVISGPIAYSLACEVGSYSLSGLDASLVYASGQGGNLTKAAPGLTPRVWPGLSIRYEGKPKRRLEELEEEERERIEELAEQAVIDAANERTKKAMRASLQASMRAAEIEIAAQSYLKLVEQAAALRMEQIEEEDVAIALILM